MYFNNYSRYIDEWLEFSLPTNTFSNALTQTICYLFAIRGSRYGTLKKFE